MTTTIDICLPKLRPDQNRAFYSSAREVVIMCGRRWGKTTGNIELACSSAIEGLRVGWFAPTYKYLVSAWNNILERLGPMVVHKDSVNRIITLRTGGTIAFWTMENKNCGRGEEYDLVLIDEAGIEPDYYEIFKNSIQPTLAVTQGKSISTGTPIAASRSFIEHWQICQQGDESKAAFSGETADNPLISREWIEDKRRGMLPEWFDAEYRGIPSPDGGNPFGESAIDACTGSMADGPAVVYGVDLASSVDYTVIIGLNEEGKMCYMDRFKGDWDTIKRRVRHAIGTTPSLIDSTGVGAPIVQELQLDLESVEGREFSQTSKHKMMTGLASAIQSKQIQIADDRILLNEMKSFGYKFHKNGVRYEAPTGMHDDCVCALALAWDAYIEHNGPQSKLPVYHSEPYVMQRQPSRAGVSW